MLALYIILALAVFALILYLFLIFPSVRKNHDIELLRGKYIAHRGLHDKNDKHPENSMSAFSLALERNFPIETDIHITRDDEVVVFHDSNTERICKEKNIIENMTLEEVKKLRLCNTDEQIPTLKELLETVNGKVPLLIEFKCEDLKTSKRLCRTANAVLSEYKGKYLIQSFFPLVLSWYKKNRPDICRGQLSSAFLKDKLHMRLLGCLVFNFLARPQFVSYECTYKDRFAYKICRFLGAFGAGWTIRSKETLFAALGDYDAYIFEDFDPEQ